VIDTWAFEGGIFSTKIVHVIVPLKRIAKYGLKPAHAIANTPIMIQ